MFFEAFMLDVSIIDSLLSIKCGVLSRVFTVQPSRLCSFFQLTLLVSLFISVCQFFTMCLRARDCEYSRVNNSSDEIRACRTGYTHTESERRVSYCRLLLCTNWC